MYLQKTGRAETSEIMASKKTVKVFLCWVSVKKEGKYTDNPSPFIQETIETALKENVKIKCSNNKVSEISS